MSLSSLSIPSTGHDNASIGEDVSIGVVSGGLGQDLHALHSDHTLVGVEGVVHRGEVAVCIGSPVVVAAGSKEECSGVPSIFQSEAELNIVFFASSDQLFHAASILFGDDALVVVHIVTVVAGHGVGIDGACNLGSGNGTCVVVSGDKVLSSLAGLSQSSSLYQTGQLVLCEAVDVRCGGDVSDDLGTGVSLGNAFDLSIDLDAGVGFLKCLDLGLEQVGSAFLFADPHGDLIGTFQRITGGSVLGGSTSNQAGGHHENKQQCDEFLHFVFSSYKKYVSEH